MIVTFKEPYLRVDVSDEKLEVRNYLFDQFVDRWDGYYDDNLEIDVNHEEAFIEIALPVLDLIHIIIEEKEQDLDYERRHDSFKDSELDPNDDKEVKG